MKIKYLSITLILVGVGCSSKPVTAGSIRYNEDSMMFYKNHIVIQGDIGDGPGLVDSGGTTISGTLKVTDCGTGSPGITGTGITITASPESWEILKLHKTIDSLKKVIDSLKRNDNANLSIDTVMGRIRITSKGSGGYLIDTTDYKIPLANQK